MNPYDIERIFAEIEEHIINKMINNFRKVRAKGTKGKYEWQSWRLKQLKSIKNFIRGIKDEFQPVYEELNKAIYDNIEKSYGDVFRNSLEQAVEKTETDRFAHINRTRIDALQKATTDDLKDVESAVFRKTEDAYRQIVYKAQVTLNSGTVTYEEAVDMATRDFLNAGINCVEYSNGSKHSVKEYASMVLRTAMKRAQLMAEGEQRTQSGIHTCYAKFRDEACPMCIPWLGRLMIDDVYSVGTKEEAEQYGAILLSEAMRWGFLHPNCKDTVATYYPYLYEDDPESDPLKLHDTKRIQWYAEQSAKVQAKVTNANTQVRKYERIADNQLSRTNKQQAETRASEWRNKAKDLNAQLDDVNTKLNEIEKKSSEILIDDELQYVEGLNKWKTHNAILPKEERPYYARMLDDARKEAPKEIYEYFNNGLDKIAGEDGKGRLKIKYNELPTTQRKVSDYDTNTNTATLVLSDEDGNDALCARTVFHELEHAFDYAYGNGEFASAKYQLLAEFIKKYEQNPLYTKNNILEMTMNMKTSTRRAVQDIFDALHAGKLHNEGFFGHGEKYYKEFANRQIEITAQFMAIAMTDRQGYDILVKKLPELESIILQFAKSV